MCWIEQTYKTQEGINNQSSGTKNYSKFVSHPGPNETPHSALPLLNGSDAHSCQKGRSQWVVATLDRSLLLEVHEGDFVRERCLERNIAVFSFWMSTAIQIDSLVEGFF